METGGRENAGNRGRKSQQSNKTATTDSETTARIFVFSLPFSKGKKTKNALSNGRVSEYLKSSLSAADEVWLLVCNFLFIFWSLNIIQIFIFVSLCINNNLQVLFLLNHSHPNLFVTHLTHNWAEQWSAHYSRPPAAVPRSDVPSLPTPTPQQHILLHKTSNQKRMTDFLQWEWECFMFGEHRMPPTAC